MTESGVFVRAASATDPAKLVYPWPETLERWLAHQQQQESGTSKRSKSSDREKEARAREAETDAEIKKFKLEQLRGEWVRRDAYDAELRRIVSAIAGVLDLAPGKHGPRLPGDAPTPEKVAALRAVMRDVRAEIRRVGSPIAAAAVADTTTSAA